MAHETDVSADDGPPLYLGLDLSTQQLKAIVVDSGLRTVAQARVDFDADLGQRYGVRKGVVERPDSGEVVAPVAMWLEALDLVLARLAGSGCGPASCSGSGPAPSSGSGPAPSSACGPGPSAAAMMRRIRAVAGAGQQHGSVFWTADADARLAGLDPGRPLVDQLPAALAHAWSPNWQDQSTQRECDAFAAALGGPEALAAATGSAAHHRFTGPQIMRMRRRRPHVYARAARISLVSSWLASVLRGAVAPLDVADVCGMNLWDVRSQRYRDDLLALAAGPGPGSGPGSGPDAAADLRRKLGDPVLDAGAPLGPVSPYFVARYGFSPACQVVPFTGDNPATMLALPLRPLDAIVSLGTSTTFLMNTPRYRPGAPYHFFNHPTTPGHYMFMLCYKNGGLARETVRDALARPGPESDGPPPGDAGWDAFNTAVLDTPPLDMPAGPDARAKLGLYFRLRETVPNLRAGTWRFTCRPDGSDLTPAAGPWSPAVDARVVTESQTLSMRLRSQPLVLPPRDGLPAQPRRIYLVGGGSHNPAIARVIGDVLGGADGVYRLDVGGSACALGGAYKALWALERKPGESFDEFLAARWTEEGAVEKIDVGFRPATYQKYGDVLGAFEEMEQRLLAEEHHGNQDDKA